MSKKSSCCLVLTALLLMCPRFSSAEIIGDELLGVLASVSTAVCKEYVPIDQLNLSGPTIDNELVLNKDSGMVPPDEFVCINGRGFVFDDNPTLYPQTFEGTCAIGANGVNLIAQRTVTDQELGLLWPANCFATATLEINQNGSNSSSYTVEYTVDVLSCLGANRGERYDTPCGAIWRGEMVLGLPRVLPPPPNKKTQIRGNLKDTGYTCKLKKKKGKVAGVKLDLQRQVHSVGDYTTIASAKTNKKGVAKFPLATLVSLGVQTGDSLRCKKGSVVSDRSGFIEADDPV